MPSRQSPRDPNKYPRIKRGREMPLPTGSNVRGRTLRNTGIVLPF